jgi:hypothetical protein
VPERRNGRGSSGQAAVELVAALPALLLAGVVALQLLATGYALTLADGAAESGAAALAAGRPAEAAVSAALPGWMEGRVGVDVEGGRVRVRLRPPALIPLPAGILEVDSTAVVAGAGR